MTEATRKAAAERLPSNTIDAQGKAYLESVKLRTVTGKPATPKEPYTFIHNTGCSECQEGYGAVTPYTTEPLGRQVALMIDVALMGFEHRGEPTFDVLYAVLEDGFWKKDAAVGVYNRLPLDVQPLVGNTDAVAAGAHPYHRPAPV